MSVSVCPSPSEAMSNAATTSGGASYGAPATTYDASPMSHGAFALSYGPPAALFGAPAATNGCPAASNDTSNLLPSPRNSRSRTSGGGNDFLMGGDFILQESQPTNQPTSPSGEASTSTP